MALFNNFPYSNTEEINLDFTLNKLNELYTRGENLYAELQSWKTATDEANEAWKSDLLSDINEWQNSVTHSLEEWKNSVDAEVTNALTTLSNQITAELAQAKIDLRGEVADLASAAAASASDALASQNTAAQSAQSAINSAAAAAQSAAEVEASAEQIEINKDDIADLKIDVNDIKNLSPENITGAYTWETNGSWSGSVGTELTWNTSSTRRNRYNTRPVIDLGEAEYIIEVNDGYHVSFRAVDSNNIVISDSGWITSSAAFTANANYKYAITGGKSDESSLTVEEFFENVRLLKVTEISNVKSDIADINTTLDNIENLNSTDVTDTIAYVKGRAWSGAVGTTVTTLSSNYYRYYISSEALVDLGEYEYSVTIGADFVWSFREVDSDDIVISDTGWLSGSYNFTANPNYKYAINARKSDNSDTSVEEYKANVNIQRYSPLATLKRDVDGKNNTVDFVSANANIKAINHRGYNTIAPENTIPAFKLSRAKGFKYIETDVRFTSDDVPVLIHDATINRTARNVDGTAISGTINIADITYEQALTYDFGIWKSLEYAGTKIPTLAELMKLCRDNGLTPRVELNVLTVANAETMFNVINSYGMARKVEYNCNDLTVAEKFLELEPEATIVYGMNSYAEATVNSLAAMKTNYNTIIINMLTSGITSAFIEKCKASRIDAETWTVNDIAVIRNLDPYISGVTSDSLNASMILYEDTLN